MDEPYAISSPGTIDWMERTYPMTDQLGVALERLRFSYASQAVDTWGLEEQLYQLGVHMLVLHRDIRSEIDSLDMVKSSTRNEIYRRIYIAHEYMTAYYNKPITLAETATAAHLSVNHFLRNYKRYSAYRHINFDGTQASDCLSVVIQYGSSHHRNLLQRRF